MTLVDARNLVAIPTDPPADRRRRAPTGDDVLLLKTLIPARRPWGWAVRLFDLTVALVTFVFLAPVMATAALYVMVVDGGNPFFVHERVGRHAETFGLIKFRTMVTDADIQLQRLLATDPTARRQFLVARKLRNDPRLIPGGALLRKLKIDELPQVWNVLRGDMSIVGPRPVVAEELARYGPFGQHVLSVRPGLTGSWQISSVEAGDYDARIDLDVDFVQRHSLASVVVVAALTPVWIARTFRRRDYT